MKDITVIYNSASGGVNLEAIKQAFVDYGANPTYIPISSKKLGRVLRDAASKPKAKIVAAGGDGTINTVASYLYGTDVDMGVIPAGTLNHFAKALDIPLEIPEAVKVVVHGRHSRVDIGIVNNHVFVNNSSIGFYPQSLLVRDELGEHIGKWPAAIVGFLHAAIHPRRYYVDITTEGNIQKTLRTPFVFVVNDQYKHTPPNFGERETLTAGQLAVYAVRTTTPLGIVRILVRALFARRRHTKDLNVYLTKACTIRTRHHRSIHIACDGEVMRTKTPLKYRSEHQGLRIIVP